MSKKIIEEKIKDLKVKHYDFKKVEGWVTPRNGYDKDMTLFRVKSQIEVLEELLNQYKDE